MHSCDECKMVAIYLSVPRHLYQRIDRAAKQHHRSRSQLMREVLAEYFGEARHPESPPEGVGHFGEGSRKLT